MAIKYAMYGPHLNRSLLTKSVFITPLIPNDAKKLSPMTAFYEAQHPY